MEDVAPKLAEALMDAYNSALTNVLKKIQKYIKEGSVNYDTAYNFSLEEYDIAIIAVKKTLPPKALPDEHFTLISHNAH